MAGSTQLYRKLAKVTDSVIKKLGMPAILRRADGDRSCIVVMSQFTALERMGRMISPIAIKALVSAKGLSVPPDTEQDRLVTIDPINKTTEYVYKIVGPPIALSPAGIILYWELQVEKF